MPRIKSSIKDVRRARRRRLVNRSAVSRLKSAIRSVRSAAPEQKAEKLKAAYSIIDRAAGKGFVHRNLAARHKSRLSKQPPTSGA